MASRCQWTSSSALQSFPVKNVVWRLPAVKWSQCATLTLWRGADSMLPLNCSDAIPVASRLQWMSKDALLDLPGKNGFRRLSAVVGHWATVTLWRGADSMFPPEPFSRYSNCFALSMDVHSHLVQPPGPKWLHMSRMASTSLPLSYGPVKGPWATLTFCGGADATLSLEPLKC